MQSEISIVLETFQLQASLRECVNLCFHACEIGIEVGRKPGELSGILRIPWNVTLRRTAGCRGRKKTDPLAHGKDEGGRTTKPGSLEKRSHTHTSHRGRHGRNGTAYLFLIEMVDLRAEVHLQAGRPGEVRSLGEVHLREEVRRPGNLSWTARRPARRDLVPSACDGAHGDTPCMNQRAPRGPSLRRRDPWPEWSGRVWQPSRRTPKSGSPRNPCSLWVGPVCQVRWRGRRIRSIASGASASPASRSSAHYRWPCSEPTGRDPACP
jgi:hypothetical protein